MSRIILEVPLEIPVKTKLGDDEVIVEIDDRQLNLAIGFLKALHSQRQR